jgi:23S rRNA (uracil1939-C5)-methyltransferase
LLLSIEKLVYGGDGLARGPDKTIFVPFVLQGEQVEAEIVEQRPGFARARLAQVVSASEQRVEARCPYFQRCGGCHYQHTSYENQLQIKTAILRETLKRTGKLEWAGEITAHASPPWNYRNRTRMRTMHEPEFSLAYFRFNSHDQLAIAECPISSPLINRAVATINEFGRAGGVPRGILEIEFFANATDARLLLELYCQPGTDRAELKQFARDVAARLPEVASVAALTALDPRHQSSTGSSADVLYGDASLSYRAADHDYRVSAGSFFQTNRHMTERLASLATENRTGSLALDLYAGVGLFTLPLARNFQRVAAVEAAPSSANDLRHNAPPNVRAIEQPVEKFLASREARRLHPDFVIVDPPRGGLGVGVTRQLAALGSPRINYVSCDPATLARDLATFLASGYVVQQIHLVDLFPQTFHIETVVYLSHSTA